MEKNCPAPLKKEIANIMLYYEMRSISLKVVKGKTMLTFIATITYFTEHPRNVVRQGKMK